VRKKDTELPSGDVMILVQKPNESPEEMEKFVFKKKIKEMIKISQFCIMVNEIIVLEIFF
jgi:hypothetical protein